MSTKRLVAAPGVLSDDRVNSCAAMGASTDFFIEANQSLKDSKKRCSFLLSG